MGGRSFSGLRPAVSHTSTPPSTIAWTYSGYGGGLKLGSSVMFTPKGFSVISLHLTISSARASGDPVERDVIMPNPPALDTAAAMSAMPTMCMPP